MPALSTLYFSARLLHRVRERKEKQLKEWVVEGAKDYSFCAGHTGGIS